MERIKNTYSEVCDGIKKYDYLIVGAGLFGAICAYRLKNKYKVLLIDQRPHIGGNIYTSKHNNIIVHKYGAHIFHTSNKRVWDFINKFSSFEQFQNSPLANYNGKIYNLPFNLHTFNQVYGITTIDELNTHMSMWASKFTNPTNLEEYAIKNVGEKAYKILVKGYTEKQWGKKCKDLPIETIKRIPIRKEWNNNYFDDIYQGIPLEGYTPIVEQLISGVDLILCEKFNPSTHLQLAKKIIYCGSVDELMNYEFGPLPYRSLVFDEVEGESIYTPVMNFTSNKVPYTRIIDHKLFLKSTKNINPSILTYEYPSNFYEGCERHYPIRTTENINLYNKYVNSIKKAYPSIILGGRLGLYQYLNMDQVIELALNVEL